MGRQSLPKRIRDEILDRDGRVCAECGRRDRLTIDHIVAVSLGGSDDPTNLRVLCRSCNTRKGGVNRPNGWIYRAATAGTIRWHREQLGWSQVELMWACRHLGGSWVTASVVSGWECGRIALDDQSWLLLARVFRCPAGSITAHDEGTTRPRGRPPRDQPGGTE